MRFRTACLLFLALSVFLLAGVLSGAPVISEFLAVNDAGLPDEDGGLSDWIEIFNPDPAPVDLAGYRLSDSEDERGRWVFPTRILASGEYLVVFASGKDRRPNGGGELHTNFALNGSAEYLALISPAGVVLQEFAPEYPEQRPDISFGPGSAVGAQPLYWRTPTPGAPNSGPRYGGLVEEVRFSRKRGYYTAPFFLTLTSATPGARIVYTTDGSVPSLRGGRTYGGPIPITGTTVVRAAAMMGNGLPSRVKSHSYLFAEDVRHQAAMSRAVVEDPAYAATMADEITKLPVLSLSMRNEDFFGPDGIYTNFVARGEEAEVPVSVEFFDPATGGDFQEDAGIRIHGGQARFHDKKPMRLYFRSRYGAGRLEYPLFENSMVRSFDQLVLRSCGHDSWATDWKSPGVSGRNDLTETATYLRDEFMRRTEQDMGRVAPHGRFVQVYLNGRYWGMYDLHERANAAFFSDHFGGKENDWDVLGAFARVADGNKADWTDLQTIATRGVTTRHAYEEIQEYLDINPYIDSMISRIWSGDHDWLDPLYIDGVNQGNPARFSNNNWFAGRESRGGAMDGSVRSPFHFFCWDTEISMGNDRFLTGGNHKLNFDLTRVRTPDSPGAPYNTLRNYEEFRLAFADRLQKYFFNGGVITPEKNIARWDALAATVRLAIVGESARWGNIHGGTPLRRDVEWEREVAWMRDNFLPVRTANVLGYFRDRMLYPAVTPPVLSERGGSFASPVDLALAAEGQAGTIYYTLDGNDPRQPASTPVGYLVDKRAQASLLVPSVANGGDQLGATWRDVAAPANPAAWRTGPTAIGYENAGEDFRGLIATDVENEMANISGSVFIRVPFSVPDQGALGALRGLILKMRYDDGFVAYLNGTEVARANAPATVAWDSVAISAHPDSQALGFDSFDLTAHLGLLRIGDNMLAIQGLNAGIASSDFLIMPRLMTVGTPREAGLSPSAQVYGGPVAVDRNLTVKTRLLGDGNIWSAMEEADFTIGDRPARRGTLAVTEIHYHPLDPVTPSETAAGAGAGDFEFLELRNVSAHAIDLRGVAIADGVDFTFAGAALTRLEPGENVLVVSNPSAFTARYGAVAAARVAGVFGHGTRLSNGGERLLIVDGKGEPIEDFAYDDSTPWPLAADGNGFSLERVRAQEGGDPAQAGNWRASRRLHGSPGYEPDDADTDADGLPDDWERRFFNDSLAQSASDDFEGDGLTNAEEFAAGTDPKRADSDGDGLNDGPEVHVYGTDPLEGDTDGDGVLDGVEVAAGTDPLKPDTDGDGLTDSEEAARQTNPLLADTDRDGFSDGLEVVRGSNPMDRDSVPHTTAGDLAVYSPMDAFGISSGRVENLGGAVPGRIQGPALPGQPGRIAEALGFDGTAPGVSVDYAGIGDPATGSLTATFWFRATGTTGSQALASKGNASVGDEGWSVSLVADTLFFRARAASGAVSGLSKNGGFVAGSWHHLAVVVDNETGRLRAYLDGSAAGWLTGFDGIADAAFPRGSSVTSASPLRLGRDASGANAFTGALDDFAVWRFAMGAEEIARVYLAGLAGQGARDAAGPPDDLDFDGLPDAWERMFFGNLDAMGGGDADGDGLTNANEYRLGTNPRLRDTDGDNVDDAAEIAAGSDPRVANAMAGGATLFENLLLYNSFDVGDVTETEAGGQVFDRTFPEETGTILGGFHALPGAVGGALTEGGGILYGRVHDPGVNDFTVSLWVRPGTMEPERTRIIVGKGNETLEDGWHIALFGERFGAFGTFDDGTTWLTDNFNPPRGTVAKPGQWSHLLLVLDHAEGSVRFFVNGIEIGYGDDPREIPAGAAVTAPDAYLLAGRASARYPTVLDYDGGIDEFALWGRALSGAERSAVAAGAVAALNLSALNGQTGDPAAVVDPGAISVTLNPGTTRTISLDLGNAGARPLNWLVDSERLEDVLSALESGYLGITSLIPRRFDFTDGIAGFSIFDGGQDMYDDGNYLFTEQGGPLRYVDGLMAVSDALGANGRYFTRKFPGLFVFAADLDGVENFGILGTLGTGDRGKVAGSVLEARLGSRRFVGFVKRVYNALDLTTFTIDPSVNHLVIVEDPASSVSHSFSPVPANDEHLVSGLANVRRLYYLLFASTSGRENNDAEFKAIMDAFLGLLDTEEEWLRVEGPGEGLIAPAAVTPLGLHLDSLGFQAGEDRERIVHLFTNDPLRPGIDVPVRLHINAPPTARTLPDLIGDEDGPPLLADIHAAFNDPESGAAGLTYAFSTDAIGDALLASLTFDPGRGLLTLVSRPDAFGAATVRVTGTDANGLSAESTLLVTINAVPDPPFALGLPDLTADAAASMTEIDLRAFFTDADPGDTLIFGLRSNTNPGLFSRLEIDPTTGRFLIAYSPFIGGTAEITVFARDLAGTETEDTFTVTLPPVSAPDLLVSTTQTVNRQTGLIEQRVTITNRSPRDLGAVRLVLSGLPAGVTVHNASAVLPGGRFEILYNRTLPAGQTVVLLVEYYSPARLTNFQPIVTVETGLRREFVPAVGPAFAIGRLLRQADGSVLLEFPSEPGHRYVVQYSDDMSGWHDASVALKAGGTRVQWIDSGPPKTASHPSGAASRAYRVVATE